MPPAPQPPRATTYGMHTDKLRVAVASLLYKALAKRWSVDTLYVPMWLSFWDPLCAGTVMPFWIVESIARDTCNSKPGWEGLSQQEQAAALKSAQTVAEREGT